MHKKNSKKYLLKNESVKIYNDILNGKRDRFPKQYWSKLESSKKDAGLCIQFLMDYVLSWSRDDMKKITRKTFKIYGLGNMLKVVFDDCIYDAMDCAYTDEYYPWNFKSCPKGFWNKDVAKIALRDAVRQKGWKNDEIIKGVSCKFIKESGLEYVLKQFYDNDIYKYIDDAYEGVFKKWQLNRVNNGFWQESVVKDAVLWMISELNWSRDDIKTKINKQVFKDMGLGGMLLSYCNDSIYEALEIAMPGEFKRFELPVPKGYWNKQTTKEAVKYMIENQLCYSDYEIRNVLSRADFEKNKLTYAIRKEFKGDLYLVINEIYPGKYRKSDIKGIQMREKRKNKVQEYMKEIINEF